MVSNEHRGGAALEAHVDLIRLIMGTLNVLVNHDANT